MTREELNKPTKRDKARLLVERIDSTKSLKETFIKRFEEMSEYLYKPYSYTNDPFKYLMDKEQHERYGLSFLHITFHFRPKLMNKVYEFCLKDFDDQLEEMEFELSEL